MTTTTAFFPMGRKRLTIRMALARTVGKLMTTRERLDGLIGEDTLFGIFLFCLNLIIGDCSMWAYRLGLISSKIKNSSHQIRLKIFVGGVNSSISFIHFCKMVSLDFPTVWGICSLRPGKTAGHFLLLYLYYTCLVFTNLIISCYRLTIII